MDGNLNTSRRDPFTSRQDAANLNQLNAALSEMKDFISTAQMIWGTGRCMVPKDQIIERLDLIAHLLPESIKQASAIIRDEKSIRDNAQREAAEQTAKAREDAQKAVDDAAREAEKARRENQKAAEEAARINTNAINAASTIKAQAESDANTIRQNAQQAANALYAKAQQECDAMIARAQHEAAMIKAEAENAARAAVSEENVYRMAVMQANEIREETEKEMAGMRQHYTNALCNMMGEVDDYLVSLISSIRQERADLINKR